MTGEQKPKKTPLYEKHLQLQGRMIEYAGWQLPVQYSGIAAEHLAVRQSAGLFDVSHMGEIFLRGPAAAAFLEYLLTRAILPAEPGRAYYSPMCSASGGTVDDLIAYPLNDGNYLLVVNAANLGQDLAHIRRLAERCPVTANYTGLGSLQILDLSERYAQLSLQGPAAPGIITRLQQLPDFSGWPQFSGLRPYHFARQPDPADPDFPGCIVSRTGYTGEDGFEIYLDPQKAPAIWDRLLDLGAVPAGLGARDSLRMEAAMPLYGHELSPEITPLDAGLDRFVNLEKPAPGFLGQQALQEKPPSRKLIGLISAGRAIPRAGYPVLLDSRVIGHVTSGGFSPSLSQGIAMALVESNAETGQGRLSVLIREQEEPFTACILPFYHRAV